MDVCVLYVAEIIGKAGIQCVKQLLPILKHRYNIDFVIGNADGATNGSGLGKNHAGYLHKLGLDIITGGDMIYYKKDLVDDLSTMTYILRPMNYPMESPGRSWKIVSLKCGMKVAVVSVLGYTGFTRVHADNPFIKFENLSERLKKDSDIVIVDFHAATTAEKKTFAYYLDGKVSAVIGSHGKVQTADECILKNGTAAITDAGRTGCLNSVVGCNAKSVIEEYISGIPNWTHPEEASVESCPQLEGVLLKFNEKGRAVSIQRIREPLVVS